MSILNRLNTLIRSNLNDALSGGSDAPLRNAFDEMESSLRDARRQQVELRTAERRLIEEIRAARERADQWEERAVLALRARDEELAREALIVKNGAVREAERLREQLDEHRAYMRDITSALEALEMKLESTRGRLTARNQAAAPTPRPDTRPAATYRNEDAWDAELRRRLQDQKSARDGRSTPPRPATEYDPVFRTDTSFDEIDRMASRIDSMEAEIEAIRELGAGNDDLLDPRRAELESIFRKMEDRKQVRDDLSDLKKKFE